MLKSLDNILYRFLRLLLAKDEKQFKPNRKNITRWINVWVGLWPFKDENIEESVDNEQGNRYPGWKSFRKSWGF